MHEDVNGCDNVTRTPYLLLGPDLFLNGVDLLPVPICLEIHCEGDVNNTPVRDVSIPVSDSHSSPIRRTFG